jgi:MoxR-like ATPase
MTIELTSAISSPNAPLETNPAWTPKELLSMRLSLESIYLSKDIEQYMRNIVVLLRNHPQVKGGVSPLATSAMKHTVR